MTDKLLEQVSALADNELPAREAELLFARLEREPALRDAWERYHLVGEAMRGGLAGMHQRDFASRVAQAIEQEPLEAVPRRRVLNLRPLAGLAVAASVAMLAIITLQNPQEPAPSEVVTSGSRPAAMPIINPRAVDFSGVRSPELQDQLRSYLLNHSEHSGSSRIRGVMPYVQIAAHDTRAVEEAEDSTAADKRPPESRD